jgi:hypothetical protein
MSATKVHPFERVGLGKAPFRVAGYEKRVFYACPGAPPQCGGSCDYCGTGIVHTFVIASADGKRFVVGSDCVAKTGDRAMVREAGAVRREHLARESAAARAERRATIAAERAARGAANVATHADDLAKLDEIAENGGGRMAEIAADMAQGVRAGRFYTDRMRDAVARMWKAHTFVPSHVGTVGQMASLVLTFLGTRQIGESEWGRKYIWRFADADGNPVVWFTNWEPIEGRLDRIQDERGHVHAVKVRAKIKSHDNYNGKAQTVIERAKIVWPDLEEYVAA